MTFAGRPKQGGLLGTDDRIILCIFVDLEPVHILLRNRHVREDRLNRAFREACVAIDAGVGIYEKLVGQFVKSFNRANSRAIGVFTFNAWLGNNVGHRIQSRLEAAASKKSPRRSPFAFRVPPLGGQPRGPLESFHSHAV